MYPRFSPDPDLEELALGASGRQWHHVARGKWDFRTQWAIGIDGEVVLGVFGRCGHAGEVSLALRDPETPVFRHLLTSILH